MTNISIPQTVNYIGTQAFSGCSNLTNITIPEGVTSIESHAFTYCSSLTDLYIPESVITIGFGAFQGCSSLTNITIPEGITSIGDFTFSECSSLKSIELSKNITTIGNWALRNCSSLVNVTIPEKVTDIGTSAFEGCNSLKSITIPESVTHIGNYTIPSTAIIYAKADSYVHKYAEEKEQAYILDGEAKQVSTNYEVKEEETWDISEFNSGSVIAKWTLKDKTLTITGTGEMKNWYATFTSDWHNTQYRDLIEQVIIGQGITNIGRFAFYNCRALENIKIPETVVNIESNAFEECSQLKNITIPESITSIEGSVFKGCSSLESIVIPKNVTRIGDNTFNECNNLINIHVDTDNDSYISENGVLYNKDKTEIIKYPARKTDEKEYTIANTVTKIHNNTFENCSSLENIEIPESVTSIGNSVFSGCNNLKNIVIPESVTSIETFSMFKGCSSLEKVTIPESTTNIESYAFEGCSSLTNIKIPEGVTSIEYGAFEECTNLKDINIPSKVTILEINAFSRCSSLESIVIPEGVTIIKDSTFYECTSLISVTIPEGVEIIENSAFYGCDNLKNINIPNSITNIGSSAFTACTSIERMKISKNVTNIEDNAIPDTILIYTASNTEGHRYAEEAGQGYIIDDEGPTVNYTPNGSQKTEKGYEVKIDLKDNEDFIGMNEDSFRYQWTQSINQPTKESFTQSFENGQTITKNTGDGEWYLWVYAKDNLENESITRSNVFYFDNTAPIVNVEYSTKQMTEENIIVTIKANEEIQPINGWTLSNDKQSLTKEYTENTTERITIKDLAGNEAQANIEIANIGNMIIGDINQDGKIDVTDFLMLKRHMVAGSRESWKLTGNSLLVADMNENGTVDITDMLMLKKIIVEDM